MNETIPTELQELHAYVDGQLSPEARRRVESRLETDPEERRQVEEYTAINRDLRSLFDPVLDGPIPGRLRQRPWRWPHALSAIAAGLFLMVAGGWIALSLRTEIVLPVAGLPHVVKEAAMAYAVYTPEVRHPVEVPGDQEQHLAGWLSKRLGSPVQVPKLDALDYVLVGGRLLAGDDGPGALLMYENAAGRRVTLYVCRDDNAGGNTAFRYAEQRDVSVFYWYDSPFSYALAGAMGRSGMLSLAEAVYRQITI
jgi:anti-sigma factor RsiW